MTLKEKFRQNLTGHLSNEKTEVDVNIAEKIADDYAIEFADWIQDGQYNMQWWIEHEKTKELMNIFKKEKGL